MRPFDIHQNAGLRARPIELAECECTVTLRDREQVAQECTTFLDRCAAEAAEERWFITMTPRSTVRTRITDALRTHGPRTAQELISLLGNRRGVIEKTLRMMLADGEVEVVGTRSTMGRPRVYALREE